jgi:hypothetical protein
MAAAIPPVKSGNVHKRRGLRAVGCVKTLKNAKILNSWLLFMETHTKRIFVELREMG